MARVVFLTGGTGFVGSHLAEALLDRGYEVRCLVRSSQKWLSGLDIIPVVGDFNDPAALRTGLEGADYVYHVAGVTRARTDEEFREGNLVATVKLLNAVVLHAPDIRRVVITSSLAATGPSGTPSTEDEIPNPVSRYGRSKLQMEEGAWTFRDRLPITVIRPPAVYGPREADVFTFIKSVHSRFCPIAGKGITPEINLVFISDLIDGMIALAETDSAKGATVHVGGFDYSWTQIRDAVQRALGTRAFTIHLPKRVLPWVGAILETCSGWFGYFPPFNRDKAKEAIHPWLLSSEKARELCGYVPSVRLDEGMLRSVEWYREMGWL